jgi:hypothetical protein
LVRESCTALCIFTGCSTPTVNNISLWCNVEGINLSAADKDIIVNNKWLSDKHIDAASRVLKRDFKVRGLVDSLTVTHRMLITQRVVECIPNSTQLMQIHHVKHHWLLSSCINGSVMVSNYCKMQTATNIANSSNIVIRNMQC